MSASSPQPICSRPLSPIFRHICISILLGFLLSSWFSACDLAGSYHDVLLTGEITVDPETFPATGNLEAEIGVWVFDVGSSHREPVQGVVIEIFSSRNAGDSQIDTIEPTSAKTDTEGRAIFLFGTSTPGEALISVRANGAPLCVSWDDGTCVPLAALLLLYSACDGAGLTNCGDECADLQTDPEHCGSCNNICEFFKAGADCVDGVCEMGPCDQDWADCNWDPNDGCEVDLNTDEENCGTCGNPCDPYIFCLNGSCEDYPCDIDGDGYLSASREECGGDDCDDNDPNVNPNASEGPAGDPTCSDGIDNDCDTSTDDSDPGCTP